MTDIESLSLARVEAVAKGETINGTYALFPIEALAAFRNDLTKLIAAIRTLQTEKVELLAIVDDELSRKPPAHDLTEYGEGGVAALLAVKRRMEALSNTGEME